MHTLKKITWPPKLDYFFKTSFGALVIRGLIPRSKCEPGLKYLTDFSLMAPAKLTHCLGMTMMITTATLIDRDMHLPPTTPMQQTTTKKCGKQRSAGPCG